MNGVGTECQISVGFLCAQAFARFKPLSLGVYQANQGDRGLAELGGQRHDGIETGFGTGIQHLVILECLQASLFVVG